jgi:hypothetical protein
VCTQIQTLISQTDDMFRVTRWVVKNKSPI